MANPSSEAAGQALLRARLDAVYALALPMSGMDLLGCSLIAWIFWSPATAGGLGRWLAGAGAIVTVRLAIMIGYRSGRLTRVPLALWGWLIAAFAGLSGLMWGGALIWMLSVGTSGQVMFVICVALSGLALSIANIVYWPIYAAFTVPTALGAAIGFSLSAQPGGPALAFGAVMMATAILPISRRLASEVLRAHRLADANQRLIDSLAERSRELEEACRTLEQVSRTDPLTGLANRRSRDIRLGAEWERAARLQSTLAVIAIDVDRFKQYNDAHGHGAGDRCLREVATLLQDSTRGAADLACRHGGEEFMLILPGLDAATAASTAERVRVRIAQGTTDPALGLPERVTISLGVAVIVPDADHTPAELLAAADAALYRAKLGGRNRYEMAAISPSDRSAAAA